MRALPKSPSPAPSTASATAWSASCSLSWRSRSQTIRGRAGPFRGGCRRTTPESPASPETPRPAVSGSVRRPPAMTTRMGCRSVSGKDAGRAPPPVSQIPRNPANFSRRWRSSLDGAAPSTETGQRLGRRRVARFAGALSDSLARRKIRCGDFSMRRDVVRFAGALSREPRRCLRRWGVVRFAGALSDSLRRFLLRQSAVRFAGALSREPGQCLRRRRVVRFADASQDSLAHCQLRCGDFSCGGAP
jgi:hypothetical protein